MSIDHAAWANFRTRAYRAASACTATRSRTQSDVSRSLAQATAWGRSSTLRIRPSLYASTEKRRAFHCWYNKLGTGKAGPAAAGECSGSAEHSRGGTGSYTLFVCSLCVRVWKAMNDNKKDGRKLEGVREEGDGGTEAAEGRRGEGEGERQDGPVHPPAVCMFSPYRNQERKLRLFRPAPYCPSLPA